MSRTFKENINEAIEHEKISLDVFKLAVERGERVDLGTNQADVAVMYVEDEPYYETVYYAGKDSNKYYITSVLVGSDGATEEATTKYYDFFDELLNGIQAID